MSSAAAGVKLGGSGYSYGDYDLPGSKKPADLDEESSSSKRKGELTKRKPGEKEIEIFLFTIKDPIRTVISKLMDLIETYGGEVIPKIDIPVNEMGPMGYTSLLAGQPTLTFKNNDGIIKPVVK